MADIDTEHRGHAPRGGSDPDGIRNVPAVEGIADTLPAGGATTRLQPDGVPARRIADTLPAGGATPNN